MEGHCEAITDYTDKSRFRYEKVLSFGYIVITCFLHQDARTHSFKDLGSQCERVRIQRDLL